MSCLHNQRLHTGLLLPLVLFLCLIARGQSWLLNFARLNVSACDWFDRQLGLFGSISVNKVEVLRQLDLAWEPPFIVSLTTQNGTNTLFY